MSCYVWLLFNSNSTYVIDKRLVKFDYLRGSHIAPRLATVCGIILKYFFERD